MFLSHIMYSRNSFKSWPRSAPTVSFSKLQVIEDQEAKSSNSDVWIKAHAIRNKKQQRLTKYIKSVFQWAGSKTAGLIKTDQKLLWSPATSVNGARPPTQSTHYDKIEFFIVSAQNISKWHLESVQIRLLQYIRTIATWLQIISKLEVIIR